MKSRLKLYTKCMLLTFHAFAKSIYKGNHFGSKCTGSHAKERNTNELHDSECLEDKNPSCSAGSTVPGS